MTIRSFIERFFASKPRAALWRRHRAASAERSACAKNPSAFVYQVRCAVRRGRLCGAPIQRHFRRLLLLSGAQNIADPYPARTGGSCRRQDQPVRQGDREPARLDDATAVVSGLDRATPFRCFAAVAPGAGHHRVGSARCQWQGAAAGITPCHGRGGERHRLFEGTQVHGSGGAQGLLWTGLFPPRIRAVYDARYCWNTARRRRKRRRGQSEADLGRGLADQGRRARACLCRRCAGAADRASQTSAWCCAIPTCPGWLR